ncbi:ABC transporter substrate-binding protein [Ktedonobacter sp. SOSP1-85]|uniref:extracellular solute-binding protein n=1 Tax=Ktedonobacter sp. SOSP1-85 TaxID=2778367 RepID=UPI001916B743|nr:extracellular solute-binding protein [Ktedonobacter sp. SOSP1-85]GHO76822.1 ABC transporter substrate-binding protein [Ktedonobacter sp. SOSP1-85]
MKRREFLTSVGAAGAALSFPSLLSACGSSPSSGGNGKATINWWHIATGDPGKSFYQNLAKQYTKDHPNVKINITVLENQAFKQKLTTVMQSGSPPDLFHTWGGGVLFQYAKAGLVQDIGSYFQDDWGKSFDQGVLNSVYSDGGKYYAVPVDNGAIAFWYNKALFAKAGITKTPTTWTEFLETIKTLKAAGITPIGLGEKEQWPGMFYWAYLATRIGGKDAFQKAYSRNGGSFADAPFVQAGQKLQELVALQPFQKGYLGATYSDEQSTIGNSHAAMELMGQWAPANDKGVATDKKGPDFGIFPFPMVEGGAGNPTDVMGGGGGFALGKNAPTQETMDFLKFMTNATNAPQLVKLNIGVPPMKTAESVVTDPLRKQIDDMAAAAPYFQLYYDQYLPPAVGQVLLDQTQGLYAGTITPQAAAKAIDDSVSSSLNQ